tara:strand:+ start:3603 stop:4037 length:435 start_codon:yes stop_codon:yes gene_type:complete
LFFFIIFIFFFEFLFKNTSKKIKRKNNLFLNIILNKKTKNIYEEISKYYIAKRYNKGNKKKIKNNIQKKIEYLYINDIDAFIDLKENLELDITSELKCLVLNMEQEIFVEIKKEILNFIERHLIKNKIIEKEMLIKNNNKLLVF